MSSSNHRCAVLVGAVLTAILLGSSHASAFDLGATGKKLLLKSKPKLVLLSKDPGITLEASGVTETDSSVTFDDGSGPVTFSLPKALWSENVGVSLIKYKNPDAPFGPSVVKIAKVKSHQLKVVAKGLPIPVPTDSATVNVVVRVGRTDGGTDSYCMTFSGTGDGSKFLVSDTAPGTCPQCNFDVPRCDAADSNPACEDCLVGSPPALAQCLNAWDGQGCGDQQANDSCAKAIMDVGCASVCCP